MTTNPQDPQRPSFAEENAMRVASEAIMNYDQASDTYQCSYGPLAPAAQVWDDERELVVRVDPHTRQVVGFSIPNFRDWYAAHADADGEFEVDLPPVWPAGEGESPQESE